MLLWAHHLYLIRSELYFGILKQSFTSLINMVVNTKRSWNPKTGSRNFKEPTADTFVVCINIFRTSMLYCSVLILCHFRCTCAAKLFSFFVNTLLKHAINCGINSGRYRFWSSPPFLWSRKKRSKQERKELRHYNIWKNRFCNISFGTCSQRFMWIQKYG